MKEKILLVEDEKDIADLLELYLTNEGYDVYKYYEGRFALEVVKNTVFDLTVLDIMLPDVDGFKILQKIRKDFVFPVIMLTAKDEDMDKITGLSMGADDYITKPFNPIEVVARVKSQLRRYKKYNQSTDKKVENEFEISGLYINKDTHVAKLYEQDLQLTPIEFSILWHLCQNVGRVVSSEEIFEVVWQEKFLENNNTVMVHIGRLREKLNEPPRNPKFIKTVWGVGYQIEK